MKRIPTLIVALLGLASAGARAESLRCNGQIADVGDSRVSVLHKCGEPKLRDSFCAQVWQPGSPYPVPEGFVGGAVPCLVVDEWLYERGPGEMTAIVRFQYGKVQSIRYSRSPS